MSIVVKIAGHERDINKKTFTHRTTKNGVADTLKIELLSNDANETIQDYVQSVAETSTAIVNYRAIRFTPSAKVKKVVIYPNGKYGNPTGDLNVSIQYKNDDGNPTLSKLWSSTITSSEWGYSKIEFDMSDFTDFGQNELFFVIEDPNYSSSDYYSILATTTLPSSERDRYSLDGITWGTSSRASWIDVYSSPIPLVNNEVELLLDSSTIFKGSVVKVDQALSSKEIRKITIETQDFTFDANKGEPIAEIYKDKTVDYIISDILSNYPQLSSFTNNNVNCPQTIDYLYLDHKRFSDVLKELSQRVGYDFYIDKDKDIHFFAPGSETSSIALAEDNQSFIKDTLKISTDGSKIINWILVEGGEYNASELSEENFTATGSETEFDLENKYANTSVYVNSIEKTMGVYGLDEQDGTFDFLYDYNGRKLIVDGITLSSGDIIRFTGNEKMPVLVQVDDTVSIAKYGILPKKIKRFELKTLESAKQYALAELSRYANEAFAGSFQTLQTTFRAGQQITATLPTLNIQTDFYIQSTTSKIHGDTLKTSIKLALADQIDAISILAQLLNQQNTSSSAEDVLRIYKKPQENIGISEDVTIQSEPDFTDNESVEIADVNQYSTTMTIIWVHGEYQVTGFSDTNRRFLHDWTESCHQ